MTLEPLVHASLGIQIHVATVVLPSHPQLADIPEPHGGAQHRGQGYLHLLLMTITAIAAVFIRHIMPPDPSFGLSPIHVFVQIMLSGVVGALFGAWTHNIRVHRGTTIGTCIGGLLTAGACVPARPNHAYDCVELT